MKHSINTYSEKQDKELIDTIKRENREALRGFILIVVVLLLSSFALGFHW
jgi:hypothetical protein